MLNQPFDSTLIFLISQLPVSMLSWKRLGSLAHLSSMPMKQNFEGIETFAFRVACVYIECFYESVDKFTIEILHKRKVFNNKISG